MQKRHLFCFTHVLFVEVAKVSQQYLSLLRLQGYGYNNLISYFIATLFLFNACIWQPKFSKRYNLHLFRYSSWFRNFRLWRVSRSLVYDSSTISKVKSR